MDHIKDILQPPRAIHSKTTARALDAAYAASTPGSPLKGMEARFGGVITTWGEFLKEK